MSPQIFGLGVSWYLKYIVSAFKKSIFHWIICPVCVKFPFVTEMEPGTMLKLLLTTSLLKAVPVIWAATHKIWFNICVYIPVKLAATSVKNEPPDWILFKQYVAFAWSVPEIPPNKPTEKIWLLYTTLETVVVFALVAAVIAL